MKNMLLTILLYSISQISFAQSVDVLTQKEGISLRGLSVVNDTVVWVSGNNGTVAKTTDGGKTWKWMKVKGFEKSDFRDIEAFSHKEAVIMAVGEPAYILRTIDGGENWKIVFQDSTKGMFLDAMKFYDSQIGVVIGDPIHQRFFMAKTADGGKTWQSFEEEQKPMADAGEYMFASSGTNLHFLNKSSWCFVTGGLVSNFVTKTSKSKIPIEQGKESTGANSISINQQKIIVVGGDYTKKDRTLDNCVISLDGGKNWMLPNSFPTGYRSCVEFIKGTTWITCGLNGVDISINDGMDWAAISKESFHVCKKGKKGSTVYLAGANGRIGKLIMGK